MTRYAWCTDLHFDHVPTDRAIQFVNSVAQEQIDGVIITGDIATATTVVQNLAIFEAALQRPIYVVLGNHDFWGSSIAKVRESLTSLASLSSFIRYLPALPYVAIGNQTMLVGHDGWYDALYGDPHASNFALNDWTYTSDFVGQSKSSIIAISRSMAHEATKSVMQSIKQAARYGKHIVVATHVPITPGRDMSDPGVPWFSSKMMGDMLRDAAVAYPGIQFTVLCGHSHEAREFDLAKNVRVRVGPAKYGAPSIVDFIECA